MDARDLGQLLQCVDRGMFEDRCYDADLLERWDGQPELVGAHLTGQDAARDLPAAVKACAARWRQLPLADAMVADRGASTASAKRSIYATLLSALADGAAES